MHFAPNDIFPARAVVFTSFKSLYFERPSYRDMQYTKKQSFFAYRFNVILQFVKKIRENLALCAYQDLELLCKTSCLMVFSNSGTWSTDNFI